MFCDVPSCLHPVDDHPTKDVLKERNFCIGNKMECTCSKWVLNEADLSPIEMTEYTLEDGTVVEAYELHMRKVKFLEYLVSLELLEC